jgi:hypothetical protein
MKVDINEVGSKSSVDKPVRVLWEQNPFTCSAEVGTEQSYSSCPLHDLLQGELYLLTVRTEVCAEVVVCCTSNRSVAVTRNLLLHLTVSFERSSKNINKNTNHKQ